MKPGFKYVPAALTVLFGLALLTASPKFHLLPGLRASVHAQSNSINNNPIPNSVSAFSLATGGISNFVAVPFPGKEGTCPEDAEEIGDAESPLNVKQHVAVKVVKDCNGNTNGTTDFYDEKGDKCVGTAARLIESINKAAAEVDGDCDASVARGIATRAKYVFFIIKKAPYGAFTLSWITPTGLTFNTSGSLTSGYALIR